MFIEVTNVYVDINVSLKKIPGNLRDFANKHHIIRQVKYRKREAFRKKAQKCCVIIVLTLCTSLYFLVWNNNMGWKLLPGRIFFFLMFEKVTIKVINSLNFEIVCLLLQGEISAARNHSGIVRWKCWECLKNMLSNSLFPFCNIHHQLYLVLIAYFKGTVRCSRISSYKLF